MMHISADNFGGQKSLVKPVTQQKTCNFIELFGSSARDRHARRMHDAYIGRRSENSSCMTISGGRTEQLDIFCHVPGFTSDFLSFIVVDVFGSFMEPFNWNCH